MPHLLLVKALGGDASSDEREIAQLMRRLAGLPDKPDGDTALWMHLFTWYDEEHRREPGAQIRDMGEFTFFGMIYAVPPDDLVWTVSRWAAELGLPPERGIVEDWLGVYISDYLSPVLSRAGLIRAAPNDPVPRPLPRGDMGGA